MHEHVSRRRFDVLISDLNLPDGDGIDLVREVKQKQQLKAIALTGRASSEDRNVGLYGGVQLLPHEAGGTSARCAWRSVKKTETTNC